MWIIGKYTLCDNVLVFININNLPNLQNPLKNIIYLIQNFIARDILGEK